MASTAPSKTQSKYTEKQKRDELWRRGIIVPWLCHDVQKRMAASIGAATGKKYVINSARRLGKSFLLCCLAQEHARQHPNAQIKYAAPTQRSVKKIILPLMRQIMETCPKELRPRFLAHDGVFLFPNGSEIHIAGSAMDQADSLRGTACDLAIIDEAGFVDDLGYLIESVLLPQTLTRPHSRIIMASTPPISPDHAFVSKYMADAIATNNYSRFTIHDNPLLTAETIAEFMREAGGDRSTTWRREYLAEVVTESENAVFPEVAQGDLLEKMVYEIPRPPFYHPIVAVDLGYVDYTGVLFGYYHFILGKVVIEDEILINRTTSAEIVRLILEREKHLWGNGPHRITRVVDGPALAIADMNETLRFQCRVPEKSDLEGSVNRVRVDLGEERFAFHPRCTQLQAQVAFATWDKAKRGFTRSSTGHYDLVAALLYLAKAIDRKSNPIPAGYGYDAYSDWGYARSRKNPTHDALRAMFPRIRPVTK